MLTVRRMAIAAGGVSPLGRIETQQITALEALGRCPMAFRTSPSRINATPAEARALRIRDLKARATAALDLARAHEKQSNLVGSDFAREKMDRALDDLSALGVGH